jgi:hypothetical protein
VSAIRIRTVLDEHILKRPELAPLVGHRVELIVRDESDDGWPPGWFEAVEGAIDDPTFERAAQPELKARPSLDQ